MRSQGRLDRDLDAVELLGEPVRRALYLHVIRQGGEVSRDQAAAALDISRELAAFHLDKLVAAGLLEPVFRRLSGRSGPGAGRPAKLYRRAPGEIEISLPQREYQLASSILAQALGLGGRQTPDESLNSAARTLGEQIGRDARALGMLQVLEAYGYEPFQASDGRVRLRNCPFHALAQRYRQPVCGMNLAFLEGVREGTGEGGFRPELDPQDSCCCVAFR